MKSYKTGPTGVLWRDREDGEEEPEAKRGRFLREQEEICSRI